jgi:hypothetical protein
MDIRSNPIRIVAIVRKIIIVQKTRIGIAGQEAIAVIL